MEAEKAGGVYRGWVCGLPGKKKVVGVMDVLGKRIGQFAVSRVRLLCRRTGVMWMAPSHYLLNKLKLRGAS